MSNFDELVEEVSALMDIKEIEEHFDNFFIAANFPYYEIDGDANEEEKKAIFRMFNDDDTILNRALDVLDDYPLCVEANYVCLRLNDETRQDSRFNALYSKNYEYEDYTSYSKKAYIMVLRMYATFLTGIQNFTKAIKIYNKILSLKKERDDEIIYRLGCLYGLTENAQAFYDLYQKEDFNKIEDYLLLLVVLLKHEDELKAQEVFADFLHKYKYVDYIDHIWDLEGNDDPEAVVFQDCVEACFTDLLSIPYFFSWCANNKERSYRS